MRQDRHFLERPQFEREYFLAHTWCDVCAEADVGMHSPREYEEEGSIYLEGICTRCGNTVRSEVTEYDAD
jgi:hypothetical protein